MILLADVPSLEESPSPRSAEYGLSQYGLSPNLKQDCYNDHFNTSNSPLIACKNIPIAHPNKSFSCGEKSLALGGEVK